MTESAVAFTDLSDSGKAGEHIATSILKELGGHSPDALIVFASPKHDHHQLLNSVQQGCHPAILVGCSSAGEFINHSRGEGSVSALAIRSSEMQFTAAVGRGIKSDHKVAAEGIYSSFTPREDHHYRHRSALLMTDALAGYAEDLVDQLIKLTAGTYTFFGGGAGDDAQFARTQVFYGTEVIEDAAVALEILSNKPLGIGVRHGWEPATPGMRVTEAEGSRLIGINAIPAVDVFLDYAQATGQQFDRTNPIPFFLHNIIGIDTGDGFKLRVPLTVHEDGSISCAAEIPAGATVHIMSATNASSAEAAINATTDALEQLGGNPPQAAIFFDCVATRLRMGKEFGMEMEALEDTLGLTKYAGCNTHGQIARADGQFSGFHNCTAVVCIIPE